MRKKKQKIVLPPELPPEISEDEIEVSDEDLQFVNENRDYAGFVSTLDTNSITKSVSNLVVLFSNSLNGVSVSVLLPNYSNSSNTLKVAFSNFWVEDKFFSMKRDRNSLSEY